MKLRFCSFTFVLARAGFSVYFLVFEMHVLFCFFLSAVVISSAVNRLERLISEVTCCVLPGT